MKVPPTSSISILTLIRTALPRQLHYITWQKACTVRLMTSPFLRIFFVQYWWKNHVSGYSLAYRRTNAALWEGPMGPVWNFQYAESFNRRFCQYILEKYKDLPTVFSQSGTFLTGGQDSRITLSLMLALGMKPSCYYGIGDSTITNTKSEDLQCVQNLPHKMTFRFAWWIGRIVKWMASPTIWENMVKCTRFMEWVKTFFMNLRKVCKENFYARLSRWDIPRRWNNCGLSPWKLYAFTVYWRNVFTGLEAYDQQVFFPALREFIYKQHLIYCQTHEIDPARLTKDSFQELNSVYRLRWDMMMNQFINMFFYSFPLFGDKDALDYVNHVPYQHKFNSKFQMECIDKFYPTLLDIPFFLISSQKSIIRKPTN